MRTVSTRSTRGGGDHVRADEGGRKSRSGECVCARRLETRRGEPPCGMARKGAAQRSAAVRRGAGADQERLEERAAAVPRLHVLLILHSPDRTAAHGMDGARALCRSRALLRGRARRANQCAPRRMRAAHSCHCACVSARARARTASLSVMGSVESVSDDTICRQIGRSVTHSQYLPKQTHKHTNTQTSVYGRAGGPYATPQ